MTTPAETIVIKRHLAAHKSPLNLRDKVSAMRHVTTFIEDNPDGATE